ncbi:LppU/SCO3897 family protein [Dactylosporangium sp. CA-233914]|uniref:LppU/SCO3897 family protein n=1 Tax=Dactylosporangium sp. CA-233914 TaxID=3239934 RepID=UPI003D944993
MANPAQPEPQPQPQPAIPPQPGTQPGLPPEAQPQVKGGGKRRQVTILVTLVVVLGVLLGLAWFFNRDAAMNANIGDCLHNPGDDNLKIVKCDSADAEYEVLGKVVDQPRTTPFSSVCDRWPDATNSFWQGEEGKNGDVLCLKAKK